MSDAEHPYQMFKPLDAATEAALRASIERFGVLVPVTFDQHGNVLDGHQRRRIAESLGFDYPTTTVRVADEDEAREIARTLNEDRRAMPREERLEVVKALREDGHSLRSIAGAVGVDVATVHRDLSGVADATPTATRGLDGKSYPATRPSVDKTREAVSKRREQIAKLASEGHTAEQIGRVIGISREAVRIAAKRADIDLVPDRVMGKSKIASFERVVGMTVANLEAEAMSIASLPDPLPITAEQAHEWAESLAESLRMLRRLLRSLEGIQ